MIIRNLLVVGGGRVGERHIRCFKEADKSLSITLCEPRAIRNKLYHRYDLDSVCSDLSALDLCAFDAAVVATPAHLHIPIALKLARCGVSVLIEKPLCVSEQGLSELTRLSRKVVIGVGYTYRSYTELIAMATQLAAGKIGKPLMARVRLAYNYATVRRDYMDSYFASHETGGGAVMDIASHAIAYLTYVFGEVSSVHGCLGLQGLHRVSVEDTALLVLRFKSGPIATVWASACQNKRETEFEIIGDKGHLFYRRGCDNDAPFISQARNFLAAVRGTQPIRTSLTEAVHINRVCAKARRLEWL